MKQAYLATFLIFCSVFAAPADSTREEVVSALSLLIEAPDEFGAERHQNAMKVVKSVLESELPKLALPDEAVAWVPQFGPCGGPGSPLLIAFFSSVLRDHFTKHDDGALYRGWLVMFRHYRFFRAKFADEFPPVPAIEEMIEKESHGALRDEATALERRTKAQNKSP